MRLDGKVAFISGGARGMGACEAQLFASEGARVAIGDVLEDEGQRLAAAIGEAGGECLFLPLDVTSQSQWESAIASVVERFGRLDILVNNAGVGATNSRVEDTEEADLGPGDGYQRQGRFFGDAGGHPGNAQVRRWLHHQHFFPAGSGRSGQ